MQSNKSLAYGAESFLKNNLALGHDLESYLVVHNLFTVRFMLMAQ